MQLQRTARPAATTGGFTLIELVVVIVILSLLAAALVPRLAGVQDEAHGAAVTKAGANFVAGINLLRAEALAAGLPVGGRYEVGDLVAGPRLYPSGFDAQLSSDEECLAIWFAAFEPGQRPSVLLEDRAQVPVAEDFTVDFEQDNGGGGPRCVFAYTKAGYDLTNRGEGAALKVLYWPAGASRDLGDRGLPVLRDDLFWIDSDA